MDQESSRRFHEVGGIAFEIPPLPDEFDFSSSGVPSSTSNGKVTGANDNSEDFATFNFSLPDLPTSSTSPPQSNTGPPLEQELNGGFADFSGFQSSGVGPELVVPPLPGTLTEISSSNAPEDAKKAQGACTKYPDPDEFGGFTIATDSQVLPSPPSANVWSTLPQENASVDFTAFKDSSDQHSVLTESGLDHVSSEDNPGSVVTKPANTSVKDAGFADFACFSASIQPTADDSFGEFMSVENEPCPTVNDKAAVVDSEDFGDFSTFTVVTSSTHNAITTTTATVAMTVGADNDCFGDFGSFSGPISASNLVSTATESKNGDFGDFGSFSGPTTASNVASSTTESKNGDFGDFRSFSSPTSASDVASTTTESKNGDFGDFGSFNGPTSASNMTTATKSEGSGDFGSFATASSTTEYGNFGSFNTVTPLAVSSLSQQKKSGTKMVPSNVMLACFPTTSTPPEGSSNGYKQLAECVKEGVESQQLWTRLVEESGSSGSLYKWMQSFLQDHFYSAIKVDPMLAPAMKPVAGAFSAGGLVGDDPLSPTNSSSALLAAEFGFECALTTAVVDTFGWDSGTQNGGPTLLDLSRPDSPPPEANQVPLLGTDLLGLDFTTDTSNGPSVELTTPTSWMDSELLELGIPTADVTEGPTKHDTPQTSTSVLNVEQQLLQLGLDTTKTTWWTSRDEEKLELSLAAKSVLDRLPNLDFLTTETLLVSS